MAIGRTNVTGASIEWPDIDYVDADGNSLLGDISVIDRYVKSYLVNGELQWFYEYMLLGSGKLVFGDALVGDMMLIGPGGRGGNGNARTTAATTVYYGAAGGAGYPVYLNGVPLSGEISVEVGLSGGSGMASTATSVSLEGTVETANPGGIGTAATTTAAATVRGTGFLGTYLMYGDPGIPIGGSIEEPSVTIGALGAWGIRDFCQWDVANLIGDATSRSGRGFGHGGGAGHAFRGGGSTTVGNYLTQIHVGAPGGQGVVLFRIPMMG